MKSNLLAVLATTSTLLMLPERGWCWPTAAVDVSLEDASEGGNLAGMKMTASPDSVKAGRITFHATNKSQALVHEVIVVLPRTQDARFPMTRSRGGHREANHGSGRSIGFAAGQVGVTDSSAETRQLPTDLQPAEPLQGRDVDQVHGDALKVMDGRGRPAIRTMPRLRPFAVAPPRIRSWRSCPPSSAGNRGGDCGNRDSSCAPKRRSQAEPCLRRSLVGWSRSVSW